MMLAEYLALHPERVKITDPDEIVPLDPQEFWELARVWCEAARGELYSHDINRYRHWQDTWFDQSYMAALDEAEFDYERFFAFVFRMAGLLDLVQLGCLSEWLSIEEFDEWPDNWPPAVVALASTLKQPTVGEFCVQEFVQELRRRVRHGGNRAEQG